MQVFLETVIYPIANSINDYTMKKKMKTLALVAMSLLTISSFTACDDDWDDEHFSRAVVTLKTEPSTGQPYMQVTDSTVVFPTNLTTAPYGGKEVRAIVDFKFDDNATAHAGRSVTVLRMDTIRTKDMAPSLSDNDKVYGNDPLEALSTHGPPYGRTTISPCISKPDSAETRHITSISFRLPRTLSN